MNKTALWISVGVIDWTLLVMMFIEWHYGHLNTTSAPTTTGPVNVTFYPLLAV